MLDIRYTMYKTKNLLLGFYFLDRNILSKIGISIKSRSLIITSTIFRVFHILLRVFVHSQIFHKRAKIYTTSTFNVIPRSNHTVDL